MEKTICPGCKSKDTHFFYEVDDIPIYSTTILSNKTDALNFPKGDVSLCFCNNCGSSLPWAVQRGKNVVVPAGTLDEDPGIQPQQNIFWGSRASWLPSPCDLPKYDELPTK